MRTQFFFFFVLIGFSYSIFGKKITPNEYISIYKSDAVLEMNRTGVPASITLAQGMLESSYGNSELAKNAKNHFGIKCHSSWTGPIYRLDDDKKDECFRKYKTVTESFRDHSDFLRSGKRYASLFELKMTDYKGWCRGLRKAGYATNKKYDHLLIDIIERYNLNRFTQKNKFRKYKIKRKHNARENSVYESKQNRNYNQVKKSPNWISYIEVKKGDTYYSISKRNSLSLEKIYSYNECNSDTLLKVGTLIYLQPKRSRGTRNSHLFKSGENLYRISQRYGIKLKFILKRNKWNPGYTPQEGEKVYLRGKVK